MRAPTRLAWVCAALAAGLLALHFNAAVLPRWTEGMSTVAGAVAALGAALAAYILWKQGWTAPHRWPVKAAFAVNALLALGFMVYG